MGGRPCDARGFLVLDPVYMDVDPYYRSRREKTVIITLACPNPYPGCFCTSVESGPADRAGSDVLVTEIDNGYFLEAVTEKGKAILDDGAVQDGAAHREEAAGKQKAAHEGVKKAFSGGKKVKISEERFLSDEFWEETTAKCLSCGACTYLCPTCYCFNITDEQAVNKGERIRSWDSCMFPHFTLETSGHNPRSKKAQRFKQRVGHKFVYYPEKYGDLGCSGCGRCIRYCPISMEISKVVARLEGRGTRRVRNRAKEPVHDDNPYLPDLATINEIIVETPTIKTLRVTLNDRAKDGELQVRARPGGAAFGLRRGGSDLRHQFPAYAHGLPPVQRHEGGGTDGGHPRA